MNKTPEGFKIKRNREMKLEDTFTEKNKRDKSDFKSITFHIYKKVHSDFKAYCAKNNISMTEVLTKQIEKLIY